MKKTIVACAMVCAALTFTGCKSSETAYRKAYERAKAAEQEQQAQNTNDTENAAPVVTPLEERPATETTTTAADQTPVRQESVNVVSGSPLKQYSVVVGSYSLRANAEGMAQRLKAAGYDSRIAYNADRNTYRVVAASSDSKSEAVRSRDQLRQQYADAWLLFTK